MQLQSQQYSNEFSKFSSTPQSKIGNIHNLQVHAFQNNQMKNENITNDTMLLVSEDEYSEIKKINFLQEKTIQNLKQLVNYNEENYQTDIITIESSLAMLENKVNQLVKENEQLVKINNLLTKDLDKMKGQIGSDLEQTIHEHFTNMSTYYTQKEVLEGQLQDKKKEIQILIEKSEQQNSEYKKCKHIVNNQKQRIQQLEEKLEESINETEKLIKSIGEVENVNQTLQTHNTELIAIIGTLRSQNEGLLQKIQVAEEEAAKKINSEMQIQMNLRQQKEGLERSKENLKEKNQELSRSVNEQYQMIQQSQQQKEFHEQEMKLLESQFIAIKLQQTKEMKRMQDDYEEEISELENKLELKKQSEHEKENLRGIVAAMEIEIQKLERNNYYYEKNKEEIGRLKVNTVELTEEKIRIEQKYINEIKDYQKRSFESNEQLKLKDQCVMNLQKQIKQLQSQLSQLQIYSETLRQENNQLQQKIMAESSKQELNNFTQLQKLELNYSSKLEWLRLEIHKLEILLLDKQNELKTISQEKENVQNQLKSLLFDATDIEFLRGQLGIQHNSLNSRQLQKNYKNATANQDSSLTTIEKSLLTNEKINQQILDKCQYLVNNY